MDDQMTTRMETLPYWMPHLKDPWAHKEIALMDQYYDDVDGIITASEKIDLDSLPTYRFKYQIGYPEETSVSYWDEDEQRVLRKKEHRRACPVKTGLVQQAFDAASSLSFERAVEILDNKYETWFMAPPIDLTINVEKTGCRLLWGLRRTLENCNSVITRDFSMCGRELLVTSSLDMGLELDPTGLGGQGNLYVTLIKGKPLNDRCWGVVCDEKDDDDGKDGSELDF